MLKFNNTEKFDRENCYLSAVLSEAIYNPPERPNWFEEKCKELGMEPIIKNAGNHRVGIATNSKIAVIVYCGTNDWEDVRADLDYTQEPILNTSAMVHSGVNDAFYRLGIAAKEEFGKIYRSTRKIIITGHSLGGGIATRHAYDFKHPGARVYNFGALRIANRAFGARVRCPITRVVNGLDFVATHLPPKSLPISGVEYQHHYSELVMIDFDGVVHEGGRTLWGTAKEIASGVIGDLADKDLVPDNVEDHSMCKYRQGLGVAWGFE